MNKRSWLLLIALILAALNFRPLIASISPLVADVQVDLGMSGAAVSLLTSIPVLCMGVFSPIAAKLGARWGIESVITGMIFVIGVMTFVRLFASTEVVLLLTALIGGFGIAIFSPLMSGYVKRHFPDRVPFMISLYSVSLAVGSALSSGLTVPFQQLAGGSWQAGLAVWSVLALIALPFWWFGVLRDKEVIAAKKQVTHATDSKMPLGNKRAWLLTVIFGAMSVMVFALIAWIAPIAESLGYSKEAAVGIYTLYALVQIPASLAASFLMKRFKNKAKLLIFGAVLELIGLLLILIEPSTLWVASAIIGFGIGAIFPIALTIPVDETSNPHEASAWSGMSQSGGYLIGAVGPLAVGFVHDLSGGFTIPLILLVGLTLAMILMMYAFGRGKNNKKVEAPQTRIAS